MKDPIIVKANERTRQSIIDLNKAVEKDIEIWRKYQENFVDFGGKYIRKDRLAAMTWWQKFKFYIK